MVEKLCIAPIQHISSQSGISAEGFTVVLKNTCGTLERKSMHRDTLRMEVQHLSKRPLETFQGVFREAHNQIHIDVIIPTCTRQRERL